MWSICEFIPPFWIFQVRSNSIIDYVQFITLILLDLMTFCNFNLDSVDFYYFSVHRFGKTNAELCSIFCKPVSTGLFGRRGEICV